MKKVLYWIFFIFILLSPFVSASHASEIEFVDLEDLSDKDMSPNGRAALSIDEERWNHAESDHFVYHFTNEKLAHTVCVHAEVYYKWIKELFELEEDEWAKKCHIYIFTNDKVWARFKTRSNVLHAGDGWTSGWELFLYRQPYWLRPRRVLAHELTHIIIFRFLNGPIPLFLNEGFAEFVSFRALAMQLGRSEFDIRTVKLVSKEEYIPLKELTEMTSYPKERMRVFYRESELLVRFLILTYESKKFYALLREVSKGESFEESVEDIYGIDFDTLKERFEDYAISRN